MDWAGDKMDRKSTSGNIFKIGKTPIQWHNKKQFCVFMPSAEAKYVSVGSIPQEITLLLNKSIKRSRFKSNSYYTVIWRQYFNHQNDYIRKTLSEDVAHWR